MMAKRVYVWFFSNKNVMFELLDNENLTFRIFPDIKQLG